MIREELIKKQAEIYTDNRDNYVEWSDGWAAHNDIKFVEKAFIEGAKWADNNPKSSWISVKDDLPYKHKELLDEFIDGTTKCVFVLNKIYDIYNNYMECIDGIWKWKWNDNDKSNDYPVLYWMPIPKIDKKQEIKS